MCASAVCTDMFFSMMILILAHKKMYKIHGTWEIGEDTL